jgi:transketolase
MSRAQRLVWGETIAQLARTDERIVVLDGDLATSTRADIVAAALPDRFIQAGIAEQNMVGMAFGLSTLGYRPWVSSFSVFLTARALDQVRMLVSQTKAKVRLAGSYAGLLNGASGKTHQDIEDLAVMRAMPNMTVLAPADAIEAEEIIGWAAKHDGPVYMRLARDAVADVFDSTYVFTPRQPVVVANNGDIVVVSTGVQTSRTRDALNRLEQDGWAFRHIHIPMIKPVDEDALSRLLAGAQTVFTVEEHSVNGGLGGLVSEVVTSRGLGLTVHRLGLADEWSESGSNDFLLDAYGLSEERVAEKMRRILAPKA